MEKSNVKILANSLVIVFKKPSYIILAIITTALLLLLVIWLPNFSFLKHVADSNIYTLSNKVGIFWSSLGFLKSNFTPLARVLTIMVMVLSGINVAMLMYYLKNRIRLEKAAGAGMLGTIAGLVGVGCASCGSVLLTSFIGIGASTSFLGLLPLKGVEFSILGIVIILLTIYLIAKKIQNPLVCRIKL